MRAPSAFHRAHIERLKGGKFHILSYVACFSWLPVTSRPKPNWVARKADLLSVARAQDA